MTNLNDTLKNIGINEIDCIGLAYDYCVGDTALAGKRFGYNTNIIKNATRSISLETDWEMSAILYYKGVKVIKNKHSIPFR